MQDYEKEAKKLLDRYFRRKYGKGSGKIVLMIATEMPEGWYAQFYIEGDTTRIYTVTKYKGNAYVSAYVLMDAEKV